MKDSPLQSMHKYCVSCVGGEYKVRNCGGDKMICGQGNEKGVCFLYPYRMGTGRPSVKVIKKFCYECMGHSLQAVRDCASVECPLLPFRMGRNPNRAGIGDATRLNMHAKELVTGGFSS